MSIICRYEHLRKGYLQLISSQTIIRWVKNIIRKYFFYIINASFLYYKKNIFHIKFEKDNFLRNLTYIILNPDYLFDTKILRSNANKNK